MARFLNRAGLASLFFVGSIAVARQLEPTYEKVRMGVGKTSIQAYIADTDAKREQGLMYIEKLPENTGMLFVFETARPLRFWMKNTLIPLAIGFFDKNAKLINVKEMSVARSMLSMDIPTYGSESDAIFALEMNANWFDRHGIRPGAQLRIEGKAKSVLLQQKLSRQ